MTGPAGPTGAPLVDDNINEKEWGLTNYNVGAKTDPNTYTWLLTSENFGLNFTYKAPQKTVFCGALDAAVCAQPALPCVGMISCGGVRAGST